MDKKKVLVRYGFIFFSLVFLLSLTSHAALNVMLSDQGSGVKNITTGNEVSFGNLTVFIWTAPSGGTLIYNETFINVIVNGSWNVMLGANASKPLPLEFGRTYYKDYLINNEDVNFSNYTSTIDRHFFYSPLGDLSYDDVNGSFSFWNRSTISIFNIFYNLGNVGINTTNPTQALNIVGNMNITGSLLVEVTGGGAAEIGHPSNTASGDFAVAMGQTTTASGQASIALGYRTNSSGTASTAMGYRTNASANFATAMGNSTIANGTTSTAMGYNTTASGAGSTAMGYTTIARGVASTAIGSSTIASGDTSIAIGVSTIASGSQSMAIGSSTVASGTISTAIGYRTVAAGQVSTAIGQAINVSGTNSVGISLSSNSVTAPELNITTNNIMVIMGGSVGVNTTNPTQTLTVIGNTNISGSLLVEVTGGGAAEIGHPSNTASGNFAVALGFNAIASGNGSTAMGNRTIANGTESTAMGFSTTASGLRSTAMGYNTTASGAGSTAMGFSTTASGDLSTAMGDNTTASGAPSTTMGASTTASGAWSTAMGSGSIASGQASMAMGESTNASGTRSIAMGYLTVASGTTSIAMGQAINVSGDNSVGINLDSNRKNVSAANVMVIMGGSVGINITAAETFFRFESKLIKPGGGTWTAPSDIRLKKNVHPIPNALNKMLQLKGVTYEWKDPQQRPGGTQMGMIAQEVEQFFPQWVGEDNRGYKTLTFRGFEALTAASFKEQQQIIEQQQKEIISLRNELALRSDELDQLKQLICADHPDAEICTK